MPVTGSRLGALLLQPVHDRPDVMQGRAARQATQRFGLAGGKEFHGQRVESVLRQQAVERRAERMAGRFRQVRGHDEGLQLPLLTETVRRQESDFLANRDQHGRVADFHSLRVVFISRVVAGGASVREAQTLARHSTPTLTMNVYSQASLLEVAGAVNGLGDLLSTAPAPELLPEGNVRASGTGETPSGVPCPAGKIDPLIDPSERALGGTRRHSGGDIGVVSGPLSAPSAQQKTPAKPGNSGTSQGSKAERLRSESNRRWRICNPLP